MRTVAEVRGRVRQIDHASSATALGGADHMSFPSEIEGSGTQVVRRDDPT